MKEALQDQESFFENDMENSTEKKMKRKESNKNIEKLITTLNIMSIEFPLNNLSEKIEDETGGKFTFKQLYKIINKYYKKLTIKEKKDLIRNLFLSSLNISNERPYLTLYSLFEHFGNLLNTKIYSPSLVLYEISNNFKRIYKKSTLEFFNSNKYEISGEINLEDLITLFSNKLNISELMSTIFFKIMDYKKKNRIKIEDTILVIDSFRDDNCNDILNDKDKNILLLRIVFDKNFININKIFKEVKNEYINCDILKKLLIKELNKGNKYCDIKDLINDYNIDKILQSLSKEESVNKNDIKKSFAEVESKLKKINVGINVTQKFWVNKYINLLSTIGVSPQMVFNSIIQQDNSQNNNNAIELIELKNYLVKELTLKEMNTSDLNNIINMKK